MRSFEFACKVVAGKKTEDKAYEAARLPEYSTKQSAGADFFAAEEVVVPSIWKAVGSVIKSLVTGESSDNLNPTTVHTGIKAGMYEDEVLELYNRSSNPKKLGLILANSVGVVDADYYDNESNDGEIIFAFYNFKPWDVTINAGDRIGQGVFKKFLRPEKGCIVKDVERTGGIGSTGK